jgi:hypothetical protein
MSRDEKRGDDRKRLKMACGSRWTVIFSLRIAHCNLLGDRLAIVLTLTRKPMTKYKHTLKYSLFVIPMIMLSACSTRLTDFTIISTKNIDLSQAASFQHGKQRVTGKDICFIFIFPFGIPNMKEAIDRAIESCPGAVALVDGVIYNDWGYFVIAAYSGYRVEGTPLINPALITDNNEADELYNTGYVLVECDKNGNVKTKKAISEAEYQKMRTPHKG